MYARLLGCSAALAITAAALAQPANDLCTGAIDITAETFPLETTGVNITTATPAPEVSMCATGAYTIWYKVTPTASGAMLVSTCPAQAPGCTIQDTVVSVYASADGTCGTLTSVGCNDDECDIRSRVSITATAGVTYYIQAAKFFSDPPPAGANILSIYVEAPIPAPNDRWAETGDAADLPLSAQTVAGSGPLTGISGDLGANDVDMYLIDVCDPATFSATTGAGTSIDTQLFLFQTSGIGVAFNDDIGDFEPQSRLTNAFLTGGGNYLLAISGYDRDPINEIGFQLWNDTPFVGERSPDGPGGASDITGWNGSSAGAGTGPYLIRLTGACFIGGPTCGTNDFNGDGDIGTDADIEAFFACLAGNCCATCGSADFNGDGDLGTDADIEAFFRVLAGGQC
jgi:hypothetical protein